MSFLFTRMMKENDEIFLKNFWGVPTHSKYISPLEKFYKISSQPVYTLIVTRSIS